MVPPSRVDRKQSAESLPGDSIDSPIDQGAKSARPAVGPASESGLTHCAARPNRPRVWPDRTDQITGRLRGPTGCRDNALSYSADSATTPAGMRAVARRTAMATNETIGRRVGLVANGERCEDRGAAGAGMFPDLTDRCWCTWRPRRVLFHGAAVT